MRRALWTVLAAATLFVTGCSGAGETAAPTVTETVTHTVDVTHEVAGPTVTVTADADPEPAAAETTFSEEAARSAVAQVMETIWDDASEAERESACLAVDLDSSWAAEEIAGGVVDTFPELGRSEAFGIVEDFLIEACA